MKARGLEAEGVGEGDEQYYSCAVVRFGKVLNFERGGAAVELVHDFDAAGEEA